MKEVMSSFDVYALVRELKDFVKGARVEKFYQLSNEDFKFTIHIPNKGKHEFVYKLGKRFFLSRYSRKTPEKPSMFSMFLRKYLSGGFIEDVYQHDFDRIIILKIHNFKDYYLIFEIFGRGNIILTDDNFNIIGVFRESVEKSRILETGKKYTFPEKKYKKIDETLLTKLSEKKPIVKVLAGDLQLGKLYAEEILFRLGLDKMSKNIEIKDARDILNELNELINSIGKDNPRIILDDDKYVDLIPIRLRTYEGYDYIEFDNFIDACDEYFTNLDIIQFQNELNKFFNQKISNLIIRLKKQIEAYKNYLKERENYKRIGDRLFEMHYELEDLKNVISKSLKVKGLEETKRLIEKYKDSHPILSFVKDIKGKKLILKFDGNDVEIELDKNIMDVANVFYEKSKKAGEKMKTALEFIRKTNEEIRLLRKEKERKYFEEIKKILPKKRKIVKKEWYEKFRWFISSDGFLVIAGRDAKSNEIIVKRYMEDHDIYVHADYYGAASVIIKTKGNIVPKTTIEEAFDFAASYSKAWKDGFSYIDVYWVHATQVTKSPPHGEYIKTGAFVIKGKRNYGKGKLRLCIGININENGFKILSAPESVAKKRFDYYVTIIPGRQKPKKVAEIIKEKFINYLRKRNVEIDEDDISLDEILKHIPGESDIL